LDKFIKIWAKKIVDSKVRVVGISTYYLNTESSLKLAKSIKELNPEIKIIFGGSEIITNPEVFRKNIQTGLIDVAVKKEGEFRLTKIMKAVIQNRPLDNIDGIIFKHQGKLFETELESEIQDLDSIPTPDFSDYLLSKYMYQGHICFELPIMTSRGCVGNCTYCNEKNVHGSHFRIRSALSVFKDLKHYNSMFGIQRFFFADSIFNGIPKVVDELCDLIIADGMRIKWGGLARIHPKMTLELLSKMRMAGCEFISYGLESGSQEVLDSMNKGYKLKIVEKNLEDTHKAGIMVKCFLMVGYPSETMAQFNQTLDFLERNADNIDVCLSSITEVMKDSPLGRNPEYYGIKFDQQGAWYSKENNKKIRENKQKIMQKKLKELRLAPGDYGEIIKKPVSHLNVNLSRLQEIFGLTFTAEMSDICNLRCVYCAQTFSPNRAHEKIPFGMIEPELFRKAIDQITKPSSLFYKSHEVLIHWLGESIIHPNFKEMVEYAGSKFKQSGHELFVDTNATYLTKDITEVILKNNFSRIHFSLDAASKETYDKIRRGGDFERTVENVKYFFRRRRELGLKKPKVMLQFIPVPYIPEENIKYSDISNANEIKPFVEFWDKFLKTVNTLPGDYEDTILIKALNTLADIQGRVNQFYKEAVLASGIKPQKKRHVTILTPLKNNWAQPFDEMVKDLQ